MRTEMTSLLTLAAWNVEWAKPTSRGAIRDRITGWQPDILVVTDDGVGGAATAWGRRA